MICEFIQTKMAHGSCPKQIAAVELVPDGRGKQPKRLKTHML
jgi:hypothetical protein